MLCLTHWPQGRTDSQPEEQFICDSWIVLVFPAPRPPCEYWMNGWRGKRKKNGFIFVADAALCARPLTFGTIPEGYRSRGQTATASTSRRGFAFCRFKLVLIYYIVSRKCHLSAVLSQEPQTISPSNSSQPPSGRCIIRASSRSWWKGHKDENIKITFASTEARRENETQTIDDLRKLNFLWLLCRCGGENEDEHDNEIGRTRQGKQSRIETAVAAPDDNRESKFKAVIKSQIFDIGKQSDRVEVEGEEGGLMWGDEPCLVFFGRIGSLCLICLG